MRLLFEKSLKTKLIPKRRQVFLKYHLAQTNFTAIIQDREEKGSIFKQILDDIKGWINNYIHGFLWGVITHPFHNCNGDLAKWGYHTILYVYSIIHICLQTDAGSTDPKCGGLRW